MIRRKFVSSSKSPLPPEVWQEVFLRVNDDEWLGNAEILVEKFKRIQLMRDITLTCRSFRWLAQPLLFRTLRVQPFTRGTRPHGLLSRIALRDDIAEDTIERLMFFASDRIAPYVRDISVTFARYRGGPPVDDCNVVLRSLVHHLHRFIGLQNLTFAEELGLRSDDFILPPSASTPAIPLTHYIGPQALLPLLSNEPTLRYLRILSLNESGFDDTARVMSALYSRDIISQLTDLTIQISYLMEDIFKTVFSMAPRLARLRVTVQDGFCHDVSGLLVWIENLIQLDMPTVIEYIHIFSPSVNYGEELLEDQSLEYRLFRKYPHLRSIYLFGGGFLFARKRPAYVTRGPGI